MNAFDGVIQEVSASSLEAVKTGLEPIQEIHQSISYYLKRVNNIIKDYQETGILPDANFLASHLGNYESAKDDHKNKISERSSLKENIEPVDTPPQTQVSPKTQSRPRRNAFKEATQSINQQANVPLNTKLRRPKNSPDGFNNVYVKLEKRSICSNEQPPEPVDIADVKVKEEMPAPTRPAPKKKKHKGASRQIKQEKIEEEEKKVRESDVVIQDTTLTIVNLVDSLDENDKALQNEKKEVKKSKRLRTSSAEDEVKEHKQKRSKSLEDDVPIEENTLVNNATFIANPKNIEPQQDIVNATVVVENPMCVKKIPVDDIMTDDESEEELQKNPRKPVRSIPKPFKQVFSPFDQSPVKKKVEAFEKLKEANAIPRLTRTKKRALDKEKSEAESEVQKSNVKEKAKIFTPTASKFIPKAASTVAKTSRNTPSSSNESLLSVKSASALKASQAEYREREKKRREKEQEALKKREALIEEKKRKREEKQLKAQRQREALEKEKMKALEIQRLKDERHKQLVAEQEEQKRRQKEEQERKRWMAKMRAQEEKKKEEGKRIEEQKKAEEMTAQLARQDPDVAKMLKRMKKIPIYFTTRTPDLPTTDCYDSDDERYEPRDVALPHWVKERNLRGIQRCVFAAGEAIKNTFFSIQAQTPDLQDIFEVIEPQKLKRTSSAVWLKPPRFTMVPPALTKHDETEDFEEDD